MNNKSEISPWIKFFSFAPRSIIRAFIHDKDHLDKFKIFSKYGRSYFSSNLNKGRFIEYILKHEDFIENNELEMKAKFIEMYHQIRPDIESNHQKLIFIYRKLVQKTYSKRKFHLFNYYLRVLDDYDPIFSDYYRLEAKQFLSNDVSYLDWENLLQRAKSSESHLLRSIYAQLIIKLIEGEKLDRAIDAFKNMRESYTFERHQDFKIVIGIVKLSKKKNKVDVGRDFLDYLFTVMHDSDMKLFSEVKLYEAFLEIDYKDSSSKRSESEKFWQTAFHRIKHLPLEKDNLQHIEKLESQHQSINNSFPLYFDVRVCKDEQGILLDKIREHLDKKQPLSLLRVGDADSYGFQMNTTAKGKHYEMDCSSREMKWWGENIPNEIKSKLCSHFCETLYNVDILGLPSIFRFISDLPNMRTSLLEERNQRGSNLIMHQIIEDIKKGAFNKGLIVTENRCHQKLFTIETIRTLIEQASHTLIISRHESDKIKLAFPTHDIETIQVPSERSKNKSMPYMMDVLVSEVEKKVMSGGLVLAGSGFAGKYFLQIAKQKGAIALDIGAMADYWVGLKSRGIAELV